MGQEKSWYSSESYWTELMVTLTFSFWTTSSHLWWDREQKRMDKKYPWSVQYCDPNQWWPLFPWHQCKLNVEFYVLFPSLSLVRTVKKKKMKKKKKLWFKMEKNKCQRLRKKNLQRDSRVLGHIINVQVRCI